MLGCTSRFLPIKSVLALLCFLVLTGCGLIEELSRKPQFIHRNGKLYVIDFDKYFNDYLYEYHPPAVPGQEGTWSEVLNQYGSPITPADMVWEGFGNEPSGPIYNGRRGGFTAKATSGPVGFAYMLDVYGALSKFDQATNKTVAKLDFSKSITGGAISGHLAVTPDGNFAFITANSAQQSSAQGSATVLVADLKSFSIVSTIPLPVSTTAGGTKYVPWNPAVAITPDGKLAYVVTQPFSGSGPSNVFVIDVATRKITMTIPVEGDSHLGQIAIAPDGTKAYLVDSLDTSGFTVPVLDLQSNTLDSPISIVGRTLNDIIGPSYIALHPDGTRLYFLPLTGGPVYIVSTITKMRTGTIPVATIGTRPSFGSRPIFTPDGIYLAFMSGPELLVWVNTLTDTVESTITFPPPPFGAIRNTGFFWVPNL